MTTCLSDLMRPDVVRDTQKLLEQAGFNPLIPTSQTCCGQPALNSGRREDAKRLAQKLATEFSGCDKVVAPSGSCVGAICTHITKLFAKDEPGAQLCMELADKTMELSQFLLEVEFAPQLHPQPKLIAYHDSCAGLRELGIRDGPRKLLIAAGHELVDMQDAEICCGFGGTFAVKFGAASGQMADAKCDCAMASKADVLAMGDIGCLLNIEGRMRRKGSAMPVMHYAQLLIAPY